MNTNIVSTSIGTPISPAAMDILVDYLEAIETRLIRMESKESRLMLHMGVSPQWNGYGHSTDCVNCPNGEQE